MFVTATFKKMLVQKRKEQLKAYEKQEKQIREDKASGKSKKAAVSLSYMYLMKDCLFHIVSK